MLNPVYWGVFQFLPIYLGFHPGVPQIAIHHYGIRASPLAPAPESGQPAGPALRFDSAELLNRGNCEVFLFHPPG